jgi:predicted chitinase
MKHLKPFIGFLNEQEKKAETTDNAAKDMADFLGSAGDMFKKAGFGDFIGDPSKGATGPVAAANVHVPTEAEKQENIKTINAAMDRHGITDKNVRSAILGIIGNESGFSGQPEESWFSTDFSRMEKYFTSRVQGHEADIESWKKAGQAEFDKNFWELVYGYQTKTGKDIGNTATGDGEKYRGRGFHQLTGKGEYQNMQNLYNKFKASNPDAVKDLPNIDIVSNPDTMADPKIGAEICVLYFLSGLEAVKNKYPQVNIEGGSDKDQSVVAIANINAGLGANMDSPLRQEYISKAKGYQNDILNKNLT